VKVAHLVSSYTPVMVQCTQVHNTNSGSKTLASIGPFSLFLVSIHSSQSREFVVIKKGVVFLIRVFLVFSGFFFSFVTALIFVFVFVLYTSRTSSDFSRRR